MPIRRSRSFRVERSASVVYIFVEQILGLDEEPPVAVLECLEQQDGYESGLPDRRVIAFRPDGGEAGR